MDNDTAQTEITPAMIAAGVKIFLEYNEDYDLADDFVAEIYRVMEAARHG